MPVKAACPGCATRLSVPDHLAGKRIRCKKCGGAVAVPANEDPWDVQDVELPAPVPAARPKKPKRRKPFPTALVAALAGGAALLLGVIAVATLVDWDKALGAVGMSRDERTMRASVGIMEEFADTLATVTDAESAKAAAPRLKSCGEKLAEILRAEASRLAERKKELESLSPEEVQTKIANLDRLKAKYDPQRVAVQERVKAEFERIRDIPGAREALREGVEAFQDVLWDAQKEFTDQQFANLEKPTGPPPGAFTAPDPAQAADAVRQRHEQAMAAAQRQINAAGAPNTLTFIITDVPFGDSTRLTERLKKLTGLTALSGNATNGRWRYVIAPVSADIDSLAARVDFGQVTDKDPAGRVITIRWTLPPEPEHPSQPAIRPPTEPAAPSPPPVNNGGFDV